MPTLTGMTKDPIEKLHVFSLTGMLIIYAKERWKCFFGRHLTIDSTGPRSSIIDGRERLVIRPFHPDNGPPPLEKGDKL